jgi:hypothetical protein
LRSIAGPYRGYPASHGCVRMPLEFAEHLFGVTKIGMRIVVAPNDPAPIDFNHPVLATITGPEPSSPSAAGSTDPNRAAVKGSRMLHSIAIEKAAEARTAIERADASRFESIKKTLENARISAALHMGRICKVTSRSPA